MKMFFAGANPCVRPHVGAQRAGLVSECVTSGEGARAHFAGYLVSKGYSISPGNTHLWAFIFGAEEIPLYPPLKKGD